MACEERKGGLCGGCLPVRGARAPSFLSEVFMNYLTPCKIDRLLIPPSFEKGAFDSHAVDCPFPFCHDGRYGMTYVGWDGIGYRTGLAFSDDLIHWRKAGMILDRGKPGSLTQYNIALTSILRDNALYGSGKLKQIGGRYVGTWHAYPGQGYESGPACIGIAYSDNLLSWELDETSVLLADPACPWEAGGLYKSWLMEHDGLYYLFYNAKTAGEPWKEQTGLATSSDLKTWTRSPLNPLLRNGPAGAFDDIFASDPCVLRDAGRWLMFYFGNSSDGHAREGLAFSEDLFHWEKSPQILVDVAPPGSVDARFAHKPGIIAKDGVLYHFYCAVAPVDGRPHGDIDTGEIRGVSLATSRPVSCGCGAI